jgi:hypothetical protein
MNGIPYDLRFTIEGLRYVYPPKPWRKQGPTCPP